MEKSLNRSVAQTNSSCSKKDRKFRTDWLAVYPWLKKDANGNKKCSFCDKKIMGSQYHLQRHEDSDIHKKFELEAKNTPKLENFITKTKSTKHKSDEGAEFMQKAVVAHLEKLDSKKPRDNADIYAEGWAATFRDLSKEQQLFAKKAIDDILMHGSMNMLTYPSVLKIANLPTINNSAAAYQMPQQVLQPQEEIMCEYSIHE